MKKRKKNNETFPDISVDPEQRVCPGFDAVSVNLDEVAGWNEMGVRVVDNCAEEHEE